ncbi:MAG: hypothetical protein KDC42_10995 [Ignavibacteriae bacterium]|nr:hypothetical protein [Ignavibacteriota bacterium]
MMSLFFGDSGGRKAEAKLNKRFFGFHFDFHATTDDRNIGQNFDSSAVDLMLSLIKPDFVQVDTKGVYGISSYPTDVGFVAAPYSEDILGEWRKLTLKHDVDLYSHYCTIMDEEAVKKFPGWARIKSDGSIDPQRVSIFSNYADSLFIPQVKELIAKYKIDGIWIDADGWSFEPEYGSKVAAELQKKTGLKKIPGNDDPDYKKYIEFLREAYREYARHYVNAIHSYDPDLMIGINWAYSEKMPEKVDINVDYLSADMSGTNWIYDAAYDARVFASYDMPWDLMSWSFTKNGIKPEKLLKLEAAEVIAMGGGYQSYWFQRRSGDIGKENLSLMKNLSDFCREREPYCFENKVIPQAGIFFSRDTWAEHTKSIYNGGGNEEIQGINSLMLDAGLSCSFIMDHRIDELNSYPFVILPEADVISPEYKQKFMNYVYNGGTLLVIGKEAVNTFKNDLGVSFDEPYVYHEYVLKDRNQAEQFDLPYQQVRVLSGTETIANAFTDNNNNKVFSPFITMKKFGKGNIAALYSDVGRFYNKKGSEVLRNILRDAMDKFFPSRKMIPDTDSKVHLVASEKNENVFIQVINMDGLESNRTVDEYGNIRPIRDVELRIRSTACPSKVLLQPGNIELPFEYNGGYINLSIPNIEIYSILQLVN